jgi:hypothetical protein
MQLTKIISESVHKLPDAPNVSASAHRVLGYHVWEEVKHARLDKSMLRRISRVPVAYPDGRLPSASFLLEFARDHGFAVRSGRLTSWGYLDQLSKLGTHGTSIPDVAKNFD